MNDLRSSQLYRGIEIVPYDVPGGWVMWHDDEADAFDVAANSDLARCQIDKHLSKKEKRSGLETI